MKTNIYRYILVTAAACSCCAATAAGDGKDAGPKFAPEGEKSVSLPISTTLPMKFTTGSARTFTAEEIGKYPSIDFRNLLTGLIPGVDIQELDGNPEIYNGDDRVTISSRGHTSVRFILDDVPVFPTMIQLDPEEIESITFVNDILDKAMYGPSAANGIIYIKTKRGKVNTRNLNVSIEKGVGIVDRFPEWVSGEEYARMNNIARANSSLPELYSEEAIGRFGLNNPYDQKYPSTDYRSMLLKDTKSYTRANITLDGGTPKVRYSVAVGYAGEGDIYKVGPKANFNRLNVRTSLDVAVVKGLEANVSFHTGMTFRESPCYSNSPNEMENLLSDINSITPVAFPLTLEKTFGEDSGLPEELDVTGRTIYGVSKLFGNNPLGTLMEGGAFNVKGRNGTASTNLAYDFSTIGVKGLRAEAYLNLSTYLMTRIGKSPDYLAYIWEPTTGESNTISSHQGTKVSGKSTFANNTYQSLNLIGKISYNLEAEEHMLNTSLVYYLSNVHRKNNANLEKQQNGILSATYAFRNRYVVQGVLNYAGSSMFRKGNQYKMFPSAGVAWIASEEPFLKEVRWIDYLKLRAQAGRLGYEDFGSDVLHLDSYSKSGGITFGPSSTGQWFGTETRSSTKTTLDRLGNPNLSWEVREEYSAGIDAAFLGNRLTVSATGYYNKRKGIRTEMTGNIPDFFGLANIKYYDNYNSTLHYGGEFALNYRNRAGGLLYSVGGSLTLQNSEYLQYSESTSYPYQSRIGTATDSYRGYVYLDKFYSQSDIDHSVKMASQNNARVGDLKYADLNGDGIVDSNDQQVIGHTTPKMFYAINIFLAYKNFDFTLVGTGRAGYDIPFTNSYFQNGTGNNTYSAFVRDNMDDAYPRLTYDKVTGNFVNSAFWLRPGGYFKIQNVELAYNFKFKPEGRFGIRGLRIFARGANLLTISKIKDVDPESVNSGISRYPLFRTFTGGVKLTF